MLLGFKYGVYIYGRFGGDRILVGARMFFWTDDGRWRWWHLGLLGEKGVMVVDDDHGAK